jgi:hypothetical protein
MISAGIKVTNTALVRDAIDLARSSSAVVNYADSNGPIIQSAP